MKVRSIIIASSYRFEKAALLFRYLEMLLRVNLTFLLNVHTSLFHYSQVVVNYILFCGILFCGYTVWKMDALIKIV